MSIRELRVLGIVNFDGIQYGTKQWLKQNGVNNQYYKEERMLDNNS